MFADRMPCDIVLKGLGDGLVNKEKSAVVRNHLEYSRREKDEIYKLFSDLKEKKNLSDIYVALQNIEKWYCRYDANADAKNIFSIMKTSWKKLI